MPPRGATINVSNIGGGRSRISIMHPRGHHQCSPCDVLQLSGSHSQISDNASTTTVHTMSNIFPTKLFLGPSTTKDLKTSTTTRNKDDNKFIYQSQKLWQMQAGTGALFVCPLALQPCRHNLGDLLDTTPHRRLCLYDGSMHHRLKGNKSACAPPPSLTERDPWPPAARKQGEHGAHFPYCFPGVKRAEAKGCQRHF
jgi:hypothetical protein